MDDPFTVSNLVNSPKTDDPRCIEPVLIDRDFCERQWWAMGKALGFAVENGDWPRSIAATT